MIFLSDIVTSLFHTTMINKFTHSLSLLLIVVWSVLDNKYPFICDCLINNSVDPKDLDKKDLTILKP